MDVHRDSRSAWQHLVRCGGLELDGRDEGFEADLLEALRTSVPEVVAAPAASSLPEALNRTPLGAFLRAFFRVTQPYLKMFEAILRYFEAAGAKEGREHWCLQLDHDAELDLESFRTQLASWQSAKGTIRVPALDVRGAWNIRQIFVSHLPEVGQHRPMSDEAPPFPLWLRAWLHGYEACERIPFPQADLQKDLPEAFHRVVPLIGAIAQRRIDLGLSRAAAQKALQERKWNYPENDALDPWSVVHLESDHYVRQLFSALYAARASTPEVHAAIARDLDQLLAQYGARWLDIELSLPELEDFLKLPIWQKRSELYAVWVATEIVAALKDHQVHMHHEEGRLEFAFRETLLATVLTTQPVVRLYGERRSPLAPAARSTTRSEGVQPDYTLWRGTDTGSDTCLLAIECKHHKKSGGRRFVEVLSDYAHSLPFAPIYLVSHGPIGELKSALSYEVRSRCFTIPHLRADEGSRAQRAQLRETVMKAVGPVTKASRLVLPKRRDCVVAIDVSVSMQERLHTPGALDGLMELQAQYKATAVATIDTAVVSMINPSRLEIESAIAHRGLGTALAAPIELLQAIFDRVVVVTDADGLASLAATVTDALPSWDGALRIVETRKRMSVRGGADQSRV